MDTPGSFGEWLKKRRKTLDLTQEELAERAGCSIFALRKIEAGERRPSKQLAALLADALEISEKDKPTFIRVARGDLILERLRTPGLVKTPAYLANATESLNASRQPASHHLPLSPTPLLGRDPELAAMERIFNETHCRLLTLTGMGGIGKTRLAIDFASRQCGRFPGGVHYVPLASINSAELIVPAIAEALEFSFSGPVDPKEQLFNYLAQGAKHPTLLVLDNLEHLLTESSMAAELVVEILQWFAHVKILGTSRERLNLHGEWTYELHGLAVPPSEFVEKLEDYSAVELFLQRARQINAEFELTEAERPALVRICRLVEGIPLALELAAAWVGMLSCREIAQEIEASIDFLTTSMRDIPERHRSLRATFDHSWRLLSGAERGALSCLSVFHGGFDRVAAERVAGASLPLLSSLVSKSLVRRTQDGRYDLHEVIRQYALSHLDEDRSRRLETCDRHSEYYLYLTREFEKKLKSASQQAAMREMTLEFDNMRAAWDWGIARGKFELIGMAVRAFGWYFEVAGLIYDGIDQLELLVQALIDKPRDNQMSKALGSTLVQQGLLCFRSGQFSRAMERYQDAIANLRSVDEQKLLADALIFSGTLAHLNGDYLEAKELISEGLSYAQAANDPWFTAYGVYNLGHVDSLIGDYQKGYEQMQEGLALWRMVGDPHSISMGLNFLVETQIKLGRCEEAIISMQESIALCERTKNRWGMGTAYRYLGLATLATGRCVEAQGYLQKSLEIFGEYFKGWDIARSLTYLGDTAFMAGNLQEAEKNYLDALRLAVEAKSLPLALDALVGLARVQVCNGEAEQAFKLARHVLNHTAATQDTREISRQLILGVENQLCDDRMQAIRERTLDQSLETIAEICLGRGSPGR
ncbi:MAG: tetratricopeptide repeat protein [Chloroflexota bacterium]